MPRRGVKNKAKKKLTRPLGGGGVWPSGIPDYAPPKDLADNIFHAEGWAPCVELLTYHLELPDLNTRAGLKKVHKDFDEVNKRLEENWCFAESFPSITPMGIIARDRMMATVVALYAKISVDSILRDRIFREADFLSKALSALESPAASHVVLLALSTVTHHGGLYVRTEIAKESGVLLTHLDEQPDDLVAAELAITVLSHCICAVIEGEQPPDAKLVKSLNIPRVVRTMLAYMRKPGASALLWEHAIEFLAAAAHHCSDVLRDQPSAINLLVALTRSPDLRIRATGISGILRLHIFDSEKSLTQFDPQKLIAAAGRRWPDKVVDANMDYGMTRTETMLTAAGARDFQAAMMHAVQTGDLAELGTTLAKLIMRTEYSISQGGFQVQDSRTGKIAFDSCGLPFTMWHDAPQYCATALRKRGNAGDAEAADIVELKGYLIRSRMAEARLLARAALERSPLSPFFHHVLTLGASSTDGVRAARQGLRLTVPGSAGYVRCALLYRSSEHGAELALERLRAALASGRALEEGFAAALCALEDAGTFLQEAPPDSRSVSPVVCIYTLMLLLVRGHELADGLPELKEASEKLEIADEVLRFLKMPIRHTQMRNACATALERTDVAQREWGAAVRNITKDGALDTAATPDAAHAALAEWLERLDVGDTTEGGAGSHTHPRLGVNDVELYRCSWCGAPSAILRKCRGCQKSRYCDNRCQKQHWTGGHRKVCKRGDKKAEE
ncbi:hypothetical protein BC834DRAFT_1001863 [Gloeopeniophorella convolvens]|nr:hypothetical protein BC834DRAFT_1001863 [Gloeopeniophorella convolvens]